MGKSEDEIKLLDSGNGTSYVSVLLSFIFFANLFAQINVFRVHLLVDKCEIPNLSQRS